MTGMHSNLYENDVEFYRTGDDEPPKPKPQKKTNDQLWAELQMWRARAMGNRSEVRALRAEHATETKKLRSEAQNLRTRLRAAEEQLEGKHNG